MNSILYLRELNIFSIIARFVLAAICGGIIGVDRGRNHRAAGFRTHILVCLGSALIMITSQYITDVLMYPIDITRLSAQVISGVGFLCAGTIIVIGKNKIQGLTTAAGLWTCACMGLAIGIGFYEGAIICCVFMVLTVKCLRTFDKYTKSHSAVINVYVELDGTQRITGFLRHIRSAGTKISNIEIENHINTCDDCVSISMTLILPEKYDHNKYILELNQSEGVYKVEEII